MGKEKIIKFPQIREKYQFDEEEFHDFESGVEHQKFLDNEDYPGLVKFCKQRAEKYPDDLYAQYELGDAYVLNGEYTKAIDFITDHHKKYPWNPDYHYVILDALFALGKMEDDFDWIKKPVVLRMSTDIVDTCYEFLKRKRLPRSIIAIYDIFITEGYLLFSGQDLLVALLQDRRFIVDKPEDELFAEVSVIRKKN